MKLAVIAACVVLFLSGRPACGTEDQAQLEQTAQSSTAKRTAAQPGTPAKTPIAKSKANSNIVRKPQTELVQLDNSFGLPLLKNIARDQRAIWTSPSRLRFGDATWLVPLGGLTAGMLAVDSQINKNHSTAPDTLRRYRKLSDYGAYSLVGAAGGLYLWGKVTNDDHKRETGLLAGEALVNSLIVTSAIQRATGRERPFQNGGQGYFFRHGTSFPSNHSAAAWSLASVIAHEYPGPLTQVLAYGMASAVSFSRVRSKEHFPTDVMVGGLIGWFVGNYVYREHHDPMLGGGSWQGFSDSEVAEPGMQPGNLGSPYVPLDSWVYPALERLAALRFITSDFRGTKPWTRSECARLTSEAGDRINEAIGADQGTNNPIVQLYGALVKEFNPELNRASGSRKLSVQVESVYTRVMSMSGPILNDSYHFGQTIANDYGRPSRRGTNVVTGVAMRASYGRFFAYAWGEYQHAPSAPALSASQRQLIAQVDQVPIPSGIPFDAVNRFRLLDTYVGMNLKNWEISFGRQSLWWGTSESGPLLLSNNAEPINMFRINRVVPFHLPGFLRVFGPMRVDFFVGKVGGHTAVARPWLQGQRISFKMTPSFEFGLTHTGMFGGQGRPNGLDVFWKAMVPIRELKTRHTNAQSLSDQHISFDFLYRLPKKVTWYAEFLGSDDPYPFNAPSRMAVNTGLYFPLLPRSNKLDLRIEGYYTDSPDTTKAGFKYLLHYWHGTYTDGHTNDGNILGNSVGRAGLGYQAWLSYWLATERRFVFGFKRTDVSTYFIPNGGQWSDFSVRYEGALRDGWSIRSGLQIERLQYPFLFSGPRKNAAATLEIRFTPEMRQ